MIKGIIFDKDGTLIEFDKTWHTILSEVFKKLSEKGYDSEIQIFKRYSMYMEGGFGLNSPVRYMATSDIVRAWAGLSSIPFERAVHEIMEAFESAAVGENTDIKLLNGTRETLAYLNQKGYKLGVATADTIQSCTFSLMKAEIIEFFDYIGADDGRSLPKPHVDMAEQFCEKVGLIPEEVLVIGDSPTDYEFAQSIGAQFAGVFSEYSNLYAVVEKDTILKSNITEIVAALNL